MTYDEKLMQQALEALERAERDGGWSIDTAKACTALRERLARPAPVNQCGETCERAKLCAVCASELSQQEKCPCGDRAASQCSGKWEPGCDLGSNPKHAQPAQQPLTDEQISAID